MTPVDQNPETLPSSRGEIVKVTEQRDGNSSITTFEFKPGYESYQVPGLGTVVDWKVKFSRDHSSDPYVFKPGELVRVDCFVDRDDQGHYHLIAAGSARGNADSFYLESSMSQEDLQTLYGHQLVVTVQVNGKGPHKKELFAPTTYRADLVQVDFSAQKNPDPAVLAYLPENQCVVFEGVVSKIHKELPVGKEYYSKYSLEITTGSGIKYLIHTGTCNAKITGADMEHTLYKPVETGDRVRLLASLYIPKKATPDYGAYRVGTGSGKPCILLAPGKNRAATRQELDAQHSKLLEQTIEALNDNRYKDARVAIAAIRSSEPKKAVNKQIETLVARFPKNEQPVFLSTGTHIVETYKKEFDITVEELNQEEFKALVVAILKGERKEKEGSSETIYRAQAADILVVSNVPKEEQYQIFTDWAEALLAETRSDNLGDSGDYFHYLQRAFQGLGGLKIDQARSYLYDSFLDMVERGEHSEDHWMNGNLAFSLVGTIRSISYDSGVSFEERYAEALENTLPSLRQHSFIENLARDIEAAVKGLREGE